MYVASSYDLPSLNDVYIKSKDGYYHADYFDISLYDGYSWSDTTTVDIEFGTNTTPELRNPSDGNTIPEHSIPLSVPMNDAPSANISATTITRMNMS